VEITSIPPLCASVTGREKTYLLLCCVSMRARSSNVCHEVAYPDGYLCLVSSQLHTNFRAIPAVKTACLCAATLATFCFIVSLLLSALQVLNTEMVPSNSNSSDVPYGGCRFDWYTNDVEGGLQYFHPITPHEFWENILKYTRAAFSSVLPSLPERNSLVPRDVKLNIMLLITYHATCL
jgi:hypothetical protein